MNDENKPVLITKEYIKSGRFECTVTKEYYNGEEERKAQIKALRFLKSIPTKKETSK